MESRMYEFGKTMMVGLIVVCSLYGGIAFYYWLEALYPVIVPKVAVVLMVSFLVGSFLGGDLLDMDSPSH